MGAVSWFPETHGALPGHLRGRSGALVLWEILELKVVNFVTCHHVTTSAKSPSLIPESRKNAASRALRELARLVSRTAVVMLLGDHYAEVAVALQTR